MIGDRAIVRREYIVKEVGLMYETGNAFQKGQRIFCELGLWNVVGVRQGALASATSMIDTTRTHQLLIDVKWHTRTRLESWRLDTVLPQIAFNRTAQQPTLQFNVYK